MAAEACIGQIDSLGWLGRYEEAIARANEIVRELEALGAREDAARAITNLGNVHFRRDNYGAAMECYDRALAVFAASSSAANIAHVQGNQANVLTQTGRADEAIQLYESAAEAFGTAGMEAMSARVEANIGYLHFVSGRYAAAVAYQVRARSRFLRAGHELEVAKCDADTADAYFALNLYPEALECYERAVTAFDHHSVESERALASIGLACTLDVLGRGDEAVEALAQAVGVFRRHRNKLRRAQTDLARACIVARAGDESTARTHALRAAKAFARYRQQGWAAEARMLVADLSHGTASARHLSRIAADARQDRRGWLETRAELALGAYYAQRGSAAHAVRHYRRSVNALDSARGLIAPEDLHVAYLRDKLGPYEALVNALLRRGRPTDLREAVDVVERSRSRLLVERVQSLVDGQMAARSELSRDLRERLGALRAQLNRAYHVAHTLTEPGARRFSGPAANGADLAALEAAYRAALHEADWQCIAPTAPMRARPPCASEIQRSVPEGTALIDYFTADGTICALVMTRRRITAYTDLARVEDVRSVQRRLRYHIQKVFLGCGYTRPHASGLIAGTLDPLRKLYDLLLRPMVALASSDRLVIVPHGVLHGLPFHAFHDGEAYLLDRREVTYALSATLWSCSSADPAPEQSEAVHSAVFGVPSPGIERVSTEVGEISRLLPGARTYCGDAATIGSFYAAAPGCRYIHMATHAQYRADNPLYSGLRLSDGWLLARDLYDLRLQCSLATLSACRTGAAAVEPGDEIFGLIRGFLIAGVQSVAASLWAADDESTAELMVRFYSLIAEGLRPAAALRAAQLSVRDQYPHPYYWAAFALVGQR